MTNSIAEIESSKCIFVIGSNTTACHPLIARRIFRARERGAKLIVADRFREIIDHHGPDAVGVLVSAKVTNEENYLAQKFARAVLGTNNVDHCARL